MQWIICRRCDKAMPAESIQTHLSQKHRIYCSDDKLNSIVSGRRLMLLDSIMAFREDTIVLEAAIGGILMHKGHKCIECGHCILV